MGQIYGSDSWELPKELIYSTKPIEGAHAALDNSL